MTTCMIRRRAGLASAALSLFLTMWGVSSLSFADDEIRTWSDASGKFKIKAKFVSLEDGVVTLEQEDGSELEVELKKLSKPDQEFVAALKAGDSPFKAKPKADDPFKAKPKKGKKPPRATPDDTTSEASSEDSAAGDDSASDEPRRVTVDWASAEQLVLAAPAEPWKVDLAEKVEGFAKPKTVSLPSKSNFFEGLKGLAISRAAKKAAVGYVLPDPRPEGVTRVVLCDLTTGKSGPAAKSPGQMAPLAVHDDGRQIVMRREDFGFGNQDRLEVWRLKGPAVSKSLIWTPYDSDQGAVRDVMWAEFLDASHLATSSRAGKVAVWKFPEIEPEFTFSMVDGAVPALSPDRRLIAYCTGKEVGLVDIAKREVIAAAATPQPLQWPFLAFSPSGRRLGCVAFDKVLVWDAATGKLDRMIPCPGLQVHGGIEFPDENFLLANGKYLIDLENQLKLWTYDGHEQVRSVGGWTFFGVTDGEKNPAALVAAQVPHPAVRDLLKKALTQPDLFVLKAGTTVTLNLTGILDPAQRDKVQQALTARVQGIGCQVGPNGTIELAATVEGPKQREISFFNSGDYKMQEYITRVRFVYQSQPVWESISTNVPFVVSLKPGENIEGHLREREKPDYSFFEHVELPKFLQKPAAGQGAGNSLTLGQSHLTTAGVR